MKLPSVSDILGIQKKDQAQQQKENEFDPKTLGEKKVLYTWESPLRPTGKHVFAFNKNFIVIGVVIGLVLAIMQEFVLIFLIAVLIFMSHVLSSTHAENIKHEISTHGFSYAGKLYYWHQLKQFFFSASSPDLLLVDTFDVFPGRLFVLFNPKDKEKIQDFMSGHLTYLEVEPKSFMDKAYDSVAGKLSFDHTEDSK